MSTQEIAQLGFTREDVAVRALQRQAQNPSVDEVPRFPAEIPLSLVESKRGRIRLLSDLELEDLPGPVPLIDGLLYRNTIASVVAPSGSLKSFFAVDLACCIGVGAEWHGRSVHHGLVIYIAAEGSAGIKRRIASWKLSFNYTGSVGVYVVPSAVLLTDPRQVTELLAAVARLERPPVAMFVDTVNRNFAGNENAQEDMGRFVHGCDTIREATEATIILLHHTGTEGERSRGSTVLPAAVDTEIRLERDGSFLTVKNPKQKDAEETAKFTLEAFAIGESLALRSVGPLRPDLTPNELTGLRCLAQNIGPDGATFSQWLAETELSKSSFKSVRTRLETLGYVSLVRKIYRATDAGVLKLGPRATAGPSQGQSTEAELGHRDSLLKGEIAGPSLGLDVQPRRRGQPA